MSTRLAGPIAAAHRQGPAGVGFHLIELHPAQSLALGFVVITFIGTALLSLPRASAGPTPVPFLDALFSAASAITTTGLVTVDTGGAYSLFGEIVILLLFQIGGLGYMLFIAYVAFLVGARPSLRAGLVMRESIAGATLGRLREFLRSVVAFTIIFEGLGAAALALILMDRFPPGEAAYLGVFHAVSAFSTAGFGLFADSFMRYRDSIALNLVIAVVTFAGGIGFLVLRDLSQFGMAAARRRGRPSLSVHTKLALIVQTALIAAGTLIVFAAEPHGEPLRRQILGATFQAASASTTTGFNTVDIGKMAPASQFALIVLMFVGAGPGGTGGGIKVTTLGVVLAAAAALMRGSEDAVIFKRRMPLDTVLRALTIGMVATVVVAAVTLLLTVTERAGFLVLLFEATSALGTVGLSLGLTPGLTSVGKIAISATMLLGRIGPLSVGLALVGRPRRRLFRYVEGDVYVG